LDTFLSHNSPPGCSLPTPGPTAQARSPPTKSRTIFEPRGVTGGSSSSHDRADCAEELLNDGVIEVEQDPFCLLKERNCQDTDAVCSDEIAAKVGVATDTTKVPDTLHNKENLDTPLRAESVAEISLRLQSTMQDRDDLAERMTQETRQLQESRRREAEALQEVQRLSLEVQRLDQEAQAFRIQVSQQQETISRYELRLQSAGQEERKPPCAPQRSAASSTSSLKVVLGVRGKSGHVSGSQRLCPVLSGTMLPALQPVPRATNTARPRSRGRLWL